MGPSLPSQIQGLASPREAPSSSKSPRASLVMAREVSGHRMLPVRGDGGCGTGERSFYHKPPFSPGRVFPAASRARLWCHPPPGESGPSQPCPHLPLLHIQLVTRPGVPAAPVLSLGLLSPLPPLSALAWVLSWLTGFLPVSPPLAPGGPPSLHGPMGLRAQV